VLKVLWVFAHPEQSSLNGSLMKEGLRVLNGLGHECRISDLYAMTWKATIDRDDYTQDTEDRLSVSRASQQAYQSGTLSPDIAAEQEKLRWADVVILHFPLWWYSVPAILKGWIDRVFVKGFAFGILDPKNPGRTLRYGDGPLAGKKALTVLSSASPAAALGPRGVNGQLDEVLFPLLHGTLWYVGIAPLTPMCVYGADRLSPSEFAQATAELQARLEALDVEEPIPYRRQNSGDYDTDLVLRPELAEGRAGSAVHREVD
jgi:NAD(P)H dehydrogenase (quinone)